MSAYQNASVDVMARKRETYDEVYEAVYSLPDLIRPDDVTDGAKSWDDVSDADLEHEIGRSTEVIRTEDQFRGPARDLAVTIWIADLPRVPMSDLAYDDRREAVENGYWPYDMTSGEIRTIVSEQFDRRDMMYRDAYEQAHGVVNMAASDKLDPRADRGDRRP